MCDKNAASTLPEQLNIQLRGFEEESARRVGNSVMFMLRELSKELPLHNLDGLTIASDYLQALRDLDRGHTDSLEPLTPTEDSELGRGMAMAALVLRDGVPKTHLVFGPEFFLLLSDSTQEDNYLTGYEMLVHEVGHAVDHEWKHSAFGNFLFTPYSEFFSDPLEEFLFGLSNNLWNEYCANRIAGLFGKRSESDCEFFETTRDTVFQRIHAARTLYNRRGMSLEDFIEELESNLKIAFTATGYFLGIHDADIQRENLSPQVRSLYEDSRSEILIPFHSSLQELWNTRREWSSYGDFAILNRPTLELLHELELYPSLLEDGRLHLEIPVLPA